MSVIPRGAGGRRVTHDVDSYTWLGVPEEQLNSIHDAYVQAQVPHIKGFNTAPPTAESYKELQDQVDHLTSLVESLYQKLEAVGILKSEV